MYLTLSLVFLGKYAVGEVKTTALVNELCDYRHVKIERARSVCSNVSTMPKAV